MQTILTILLKITETETETEQNAGQVSMPAIKAGNIALH